MEHIDDRIKALQKRSLQVLPLHYRRETPSKLLPVEALCEYDTDEVHQINFFEMLFRIKLISTNVIAKTE